MTTDLHADLPPDVHLDAAFAALRSGLASQDAPRGVEKELMAAFAAAHRRVRWYQRLSPAQWGLAGSAAALLLALPLVLRAPPHQHEAGAALLQRDGGAAFIALESLERIEGEPDARVLETQVQRSALAPLGVAVTPENAGDTVRAEMLVGADGSALALRLSAAP